MINNRNKVYENIMTAIRREVEREVNERLDNGYSERPLKVRRPMRALPTRRGERVEEGWLKNTAVAGAAALSMLGGPRAHAANTANDVVKPATELSDTATRSLSVDVVNVGYSADALKLYSQLTKLYKDQNEGALTKSIDNKGKGGFDKYLTAQFKDGDQIVQFQSSTGKTYEILIPASVDATDLNDVKAYAKACVKNDVSSFKIGSDATKSAVKAYNSTRTGTNSDTYYAR